jgi:ribosomal protein L37AE/L43A
MSDSWYVVPIEATRKAPDDSTKHECPKCKEGTVSVNVENDTMECDLCDYEVVYEA